MPVIAPAVRATPRLTFIFCVIATTIGPGAWIYFGSYVGGWILPVELILGLLAGCALGELARELIYEIRGDEFVVRLWCVGWRLQRHALDDLAHLERRQALFGAPESALVRFRSGKTTEIPAGHHGSQALIQHLEDRLAYNVWKAGTT
jgi:hypothetical protein